MAKKTKRSGGKRKAPAAFAKYATTMKMSKGKSCNRKAMLRAVSAGSSPSEAVRRHCR